MENLFLAKTIPEEETIIEHTEKLLEQYERIKALYPNIQYLNWEILKWACLYHDLGKMNTKFQNKLMSKLEKGYLLEDNLPGIQEIPHGYLSPAFLPKNKLKEEFKDDDKLRILYQSIYFHHNREKVNNSEDIRTTVKKDLSKYRDSLNYDKIDMSEDIYPSFSRYIKRRIPHEDDSKEVAYQYIMTKGLLNKIDYAASAHINAEEKNDNLLEKTVKYLDKNGYTPNELQKYMMENQDKNNIILASTGIGKTEAALLWIGNNKGFFTLPLKVSINAIYDRVKSNIDFQKVALLHSDTYAEYLKRNNEELDIDYYEKTKQMSMPLTVCTLDQLIDFVFKHEGFQLKLATLSYAKLIIDEIQMYSPDLIAYLIMALKYMTEIGGKFSIVTATLPEIILDFMREEEIEFNKPVICYKKEGGKIQLRHRLEVLEEDINVNYIASNFKNKKILVIVNTIGKAQQLYHQLKKALEKEQASVHMFHSRFIKKDRAEKENMIIKMGKLENKAAGIWITTQVVEASLDIDFDVLYTELSDISGLLQRMGRVFRNRNLISSETNVYVYVGKDKRTSGVWESDKSIIDHKIFDLSKQAIKQYHGKKLDEQDKMELVKKVYSKQNLESADYYKRIKKTIHWVKSIKEYELEKSDIKLRNILNNPVIPKCIYDEFKSKIDNNIKIIKENKKGFERQSSKNEIRKLQVEIPRFQFLSAQHNGYIVDWIELDKYNKIAVIAYDYSFETGLEKPKNNKGFDEELQFM